MSQFKAFETQIFNQDALIRALCRCKNRNDQLIQTGWLEVHEQAQNLYGYQGDKRDQKANIILRKEQVGGAANDLGFIKDKEGRYSAIISEYDSTYYTEGWLAKLYTYYNVECSKMEFEKKGYEYTESLDKQGRIQLLADYQTPQDIFAPRIQMEGW